MKKIFNGLLMILFTIASIYVYSFPLAGDTAPYFKVIDGNDNCLTLNSIKNKIVIGFYGSKGTRNMNRPLITEMNKFYKDNYSLAKNKVFRLSIVDASSANFFTKPFWKYKMRSISKEEGVTIYGDWNGHMLKTYGFPRENGSTFLVIDKGVIKYRRSGVIPKSEFPKIKRLILKLLKA